MLEQNLFSTGSKPSLKAVLQTRENRAILEAKLATKYLLPVLAFKLNIPGPVKNNEVIRQVFQRGYDEIHNMLKKNNWNLLYEKSLNLSTGPEYICVVAAKNAIKLKKEAIQLEETEFGRIYDIDILIKNKEGIFSIDRTQLGYLERKCLICDNNARVCGRSRTHSVKEMQQKLTEILLKHKIISLDKK